MSRQSRAEYAMVSLVRELWLFTRIRKKFWLFPIMLLILVGGLAIYDKDTMTAH
jgi:hypothetical protein